MSILLLGQSERFLVFVSVLSTTKVKSVWSVLLSKKDKPKSRFGSRRLVTTLTSSRV